MKTPLTYFAKQFLTLFAALGALILVASFASAQSSWSGPTASAPGGNVPAPINIGDDWQTKEGPIGSQAFIASNEFCLDGDCIDVWGDLGDYIGDSGGDGGGDGSGGGGTGFVWGDQCSRLNGRNTTLSCNSDEYLVDIMCSDDGSDGDCATSRIVSGYGGQARQAGNGYISILCCKDF